MSAGRLEVQRASRAAHIPSDRRLRAWAAALLPRGATVTVRFVTPREGRRLNHEFRGKDRATNVLSFAYDHGRGAPLAGDIVVCPAIVKREAREQGKPLEAHYAHMLVHGLLHLQGFDHEREGEARRMERRERSVLARLGFPDPY